MCDPFPFRTVLVTLANGVQGSAVVRAALRRGYSVRALVRDPAKAQGLRALGADLATGDLDDAASLGRACRGVDHLVLQVPTGPLERMAAQARNAVSAAKAAGLGSLVLKLASASRPHPCEEPSFVANAAVEAIVRGSGLPFALVRPTLYLDNLLKPSALADLRRHGLFAPPIPADLPVAWTSAEDCAEAALCLLAAGVEGGDHRIAGPQALTGGALAETLTAGLDRPVRYEAQPLEAFEREVDAALGRGLGRQIASKFRYFAEHPAEAERILSRPFAPAPAVLSGFAPTPVEAWARARREALLGSAVAEE